MLSIFTRVQKKLCGKRFMYQNIVCKYCLCIACNLYVKISKYVVSFILSITKDLNLIL